jgi:hypothetical protein
MVCWCGFTAIPATRIFSNENPANVQNSRGLRQTQHLQDYFVASVWAASEADPGVSRENLESQFGGRLAELQ